MTPSAGTAVVVGSHRMYATLPTCLAGFQAMLPDPRDLIFVINGRSPELEALAARDFPSITSLSLPSNRYFCAGYNAGIRLALDRGYEFVLIANADAEVANPSFLANLHAAAKRRPRAAFLGPLVYHRSRERVQKTCLRYPSIAYHTLVWLPSRAAPRLISPQRAREREVDFLNGVCVLCRAAALRDVGLMDESFGAYVEDADWSWRARARGWTSMFVPVPSIVHHEETDGYEPFSVKSFMLKRNTVLWFLKTGRRTSAELYAGASLALARCRALSAPTSLERRQHRHFTRALELSCRGLLRGREPGPWFGPPLGVWDAAQPACGSAE